MINAPKNVISFDRIALAAELLREGQPVRLIVRGYSMRPLIPDGTAIELEPVEPDQIQPGDVILTCSQHPVFGLVYMVHRLLFLSKDSPPLITTRGDAVFELDPSLPATVDTVIGRVVKVELNGRTYDYQKSRWRILNRVLGWLSAEQITRLIKQDNAANPATLGKQWQSQRQIVERKLYSAFFNFLRHLALKYC